MTPFEWNILEKKRMKKLKIRRRSNVMSEQTVVKLIDLALRNPDFYLDELQLHLFRLTNSFVSTPTISRMLHDKGLSIKVLGNMAEDIDDARRVQYLNELHDAADKPSMFIFVDEAQKDRLAGRRRRGWTCIGYKPRGSFQHHDQGRYTFIAAANVDGFVIGACTTVMRSSRPEVSDEDIGTVDRERFEQYVEHDLVRCLGQYAFEEQHSIVVMDNSSTHRGPRTRELIERAGARLIYLAERSPDLSPIEPMFHVYKADLKRWRNPDLRRAHFHAMLSVTPAKARSFYASLKGAIRNVVLLNDYEKEENERIEMAATAAAMTVAVAAVTTFNSLHA